MEEQKIATIRALIDLEDNLKQEVLALRRSACVKAAKRREVTALISDQDRLDVLAAELVEAQWSIK